MSSYIIIGNGAAGTYAAENIRKNDKSGRITVMTDESLPFYYRIRLNELISGDAGEKDLLARKEDWYRENNIDLMLNTRVLRVDPDNRTVVTEKNEVFSYDKLLIAAGSHSFIPPIEGADTAGVFSIRDAADAGNIISYSGDIKNVVVIGGGLLGLEAGNAFRKTGKNVKIVEFFPRLLPRQLDVDGAQRLQTIMEGMGFTFRLGAKTQRIEGDEKVTAVRLESGEVLSAGMVVISAGVRPNMELAESAGLETDKGIKVDRHLMTSRPGIYAAGDVAEYNGMPYGIWPAAMEQGKAAGINMAGGDSLYEGTTMANTLKVVGIDFASAGNIDAENEYEAVIRSDDNTYKKIVLENNRIIGCIMLGETGSFNKITGLMNRKTDISGIKGDILKDNFDFSSI